MATTPAGAEVAQSASTNWKKIWTKKIQPHADQRYYKKADSDARYSTKTETSSALAGVYSKPDADARFQPKGSYAPAGSSFTKAESDARYAPARPLFQGTWMVGGTAAGITHYTQSVSFGATFSTPPAIHYVRQGAAVPAGCSGNAASPNAAPGHLCVFEGYVGGANWSPNRGICSSVGSCFTANTYGAAIYAYTTGAGTGEIMGSWAARPLAVANPGYAARESGAVNDPASVGAVGSGR